MSAPAISMVTGAACAAFSAGMYYAAGVPSSQIFGPSLVRSQHPQAVALTFDDGPSESTPAVLDALAEAGAAATFFQIGSNAKRLPELARRVAREGHEIASHTETHPRFYLCSPARIAREIEQGQRSLESVHGVAPHLFRPPYGARWFGMYPAVDRLGLRVVMWSVSSRDWERPAPSRRTSPPDSPSSWIQEQVIDHTRPGDVVLMHDGDTTTSGDRRQETARAVRAILAAFSARGLRAVTVSQLFGLTL
jgi:peptidoglycan/xylan/chitin deacetylase (PgdA/CDA1 family)